MQALAYICLSLAHAGVGERAALSNRSSSRGNVQTAFLNHVATLRVDPCRLRYLRPSPSSLG